MRLRSFLRPALSVAALGLMLTLFGIALWPVPGKYPIALPAIATLASLVAVYRYRYEADDVGAALIAVVTVVGLATWSLARWLGLGPPAAFALGALLCVLPVLVLVVALVRAGSADPPDLDDDEPSASPGAPR